MKNAIILFFLALMTFCMCVFSGECSNAAYEALKMCASVLIPSLLPFFIISSIIVKTGIAFDVSRKLSLPARLLFNVGGAGSLCFVMGIVSGCPSGAVCIREMYTSGQISKNEAQRLLAFSNNCGPLFVIGAVGGGMLKSTYLGAALYIIHIVSAISVGIIFKCISKNDSVSQGANFQKRVGFSRAFSDAVRSSYETMLMVCTYTVAFAVIIAIMGKFPYFSYLSPIVEMTNGIKMISNLPVSIGAKFCLSSAAIGFSGIAVCMQVNSVISDSGLKMHSCVSGKILQSVISLVISSAFVFAANI